MGDASDSYVAYKYLTTGRIVEEACAAPGARLSCHPECDNSFSALDRFGRVVDQKWYDHGASEVRDRYRYGYDRAGNRLYRENTTTSGKDEFYGYDAINRLIAFDRGDLNAGKTAISGTPVREEDWNLDPLGNWPGYVQKTSGTTDLDQSRTHNKVNEITAITATTGTDWADPVHDRAGNMTTIPKPSSPADALSCQYDAWNRLVEVMDGQTLVGQYRYDGLNRRIRRYAGAPDTHVHYFYNSGWQMFETRETGTQSAPAETVQPKHQYAWSLRYIDAPILRDENTNADGLCDDERLYYLGDANFNVTTLVNAVGEAVEHYVYEPYGQVTFYDEQWVSGTASTYGNTYLYTGREYDVETEFYHYRNRHCDVSLGRFLTRDPKAYDPGGSNSTGPIARRTKGRFNRDRSRPYEYVGSNPLSRLDPTGLRHFTFRIHYHFQRTTLTAAMEAEVTRIVMQCMGSTAGSQHTVSIVFVPIPNREAYDAIEFGWFYDRRHGWCPSAVNLGMRDSLNAGSTIGQGADFKGNMNPNQISLFAQTQRQNFDIAVAAVIVHEVMHHGILTSRHYVTAGTIDAKTPKIGTTLSPKCCTKLVKECRLRAKDR